MTVDQSLLDRLRTRGEEVLTQISGELMSNPRFMRAMEGALRGKEKLEEAARRAVRSMNIPTRTEFERALSRIESLERQLAARRTGSKTRGKTSPRVAKRRATGRGGAKARR